jgi:Tfp pilus assembly protein PilE
MKSRGFTAIEAIIIVVIAAIIVTLGLIAYNRFFKPSTETVQTTTSAQTTVTEVKSVSDLDKAASDLEAIDLSDASETSTLDSETADF